MKKAAVITVLAFLATGIFFTSSCKKTNEAPVIDLEEPTENDTVLLGNEIHIEGEATDDNELHEMVILVKYVGDTIFAEYPSVHALKSYNFHYHDSTEAVGTYTVQVTAKDHENAVTTVERNVTVVP